MPTVLILYFVIPRKYIKTRKYLLLAFSILFYSAGEIGYIFVLLACIVVTYLLSAKIEKGKTWAVAATIILNLSPLIFFKYYSFLAVNINLLFGKEFLKTIDIALPIGISFYTFQIISYIVDLRKGKISRQRDIGLLVLYIMFFPQLIAGPIVRYEDIQYSLHNSTESWAKIQKGTGRFIIGLSKKVLIANQVGYIATEVMDNSVSSIHTSLLWLAVFAYTMQIYFDFSGYSDMAIGLGTIFGFDFPENFDKPYHSRSVTEFWRRWHMTLGSFFRDYVYIPMGGNRVSIPRWIVNVMVVWTLTGFWHGASWNFAIWGGIYGILLIVEKTFAGRWLKKIPGFFSWAVTFFLVMLGWGIFMCDGYSISQMMEFIGRLFYDGVVKDPVTIGSLSLWSYLPYCVIAFVISSPIGGWIEKGWKKIYGGRESVVLNIAHDAVFIGLFLLCIVYIVGSSYNPFIYFRF